MQTTPRWGTRSPDLTGTPDSVADVPLWMRNLAIDLDDVAKDDQGLLADRPISTAGTPGAFGRYYFSTDTGQLDRDMGTGWRRIAPGHLIGVHASRPNTGLAELNGVTYYSSDKGMEWYCDGAAWQLVNADPVPLASSTLPTSPVDGQRISVPWGKSRFVARYDASLVSTSAKWVVEGAVPQAVKRTASGNLQVADGTLYQPPLQIPMLWVGDYFAEANLAVRFQSGNTVATGLLIYNGSDVGVPGLRWASGSTGGATWYESSATHGEFIVSAAGAYLQVAVNTGAASGTPAVVESGTLAVTPLRIG